MEGPMGRSKVSRGIVQLQRPRTGSSGQASSQVLWSPSSQALYRPLTACAGGPGQQFDCVVPRLRPMTGNRVLGRVRTHVSGQGARQAVGNPTPTEMKELLSQLEEMKQKLVESECKLREQPLVPDTRCAEMEEEIETLRTKCSNEERRYNSESRGWEREKAAQLEAIAVANRRLDCEKEYRVKLEILSKRLKNEAENTSREYMKGEELIEDLTRKLVSEQVVRAAREKDCVKLNLELNQIRSHIAFLTGSPSAGCADVQDSDLVREYS